MSFRLTARTVEGIFMATYGEHFLKIEASEIMDGTDCR